MPTWGRRSGKTASAGSSASANGSAPPSASPSPAGSPAKRFSLISSSPRGAAPQAGVTSTAPRNPGTPTKAIPTVSVSPPEAAESARAAKAPAPADSVPGSDGSYSPESGSSPDEEHDSVPPSLTTGSTSTSVDSLNGPLPFDLPSPARSALAAVAGTAAIDDGSVVKGRTSGSAVVVAAGETTVVPPTSHESSSDGSALLHSEFGFCSNPNYRHVSTHRAGSSLPSPVEEEPSYYVVLSTYISYLSLIVIGHIRDFLGKRFHPAAYRHLVESNGYAALNSDFDSFYTRRLKTRLDDCFSRPVTGVCGRTVLTLNRTSDDYYKSFRLTGEKTRALNISAYNYLGFAQSHGGCADAVEESLRRYGVSSFGSRLGAGSLDLHAQAERLVARFVGQPEACIISMGFATNSTTIPAIAGAGTLIISDEYNHSSLRFGARLSGASIRQFKHNDMKELESLLRECISQGMPRTHRPWKKILLIVEGLYSMEGTVVNLPVVMQLKEKYKFYLYVDEAHSIGALGPNGRGVCDYFGIDPRRVDILMGTFTKSFGAAGGYIAGSKEIIDRVRLANHANVYGETLAPPVLTQIIASMASIMGVSLDANSQQLLPKWVDLPPRLLDGSEGRERLRRLAFNARYLSSGLRKLGFIVYGHRDSPIVPLLIFHPAKMPMFSRLMLDRQRSLPPHRRVCREDGPEFEEQNAKELAILSDPASGAGGDETPARPPIVVVVVGYPATPLISSRVRFCVSASHTKKDMDDVLRACDEVGGLLAMKYGSGGPGGVWPIDKVIERALDLVQWNGEDAI